MLWFVEECWLTSNLVHNERTPARPLAGIVVQDALDHGALQQRKISTSHSDVRMLRRRGRKFSLSTVGMPALISFEADDLVLSVQPAGFPASRQACGEPLRSVACVEPARETQRRTPGHKNGATNDIGAPGCK